MNKKLMAVAVAAALAAPAVAVAQTTIYGRFNAEYGLSTGQMDQPGAGGPNGPGRETADGFNSGASYVGIRGEEKLGGGYSAWYQCETRARWGADTNPRQNQTVDGSLPVTINDSSICDRNSGLGIKGGFGNFWVGRWDTAIETQSGNTRFVGSTGFQGAQHILTEDQAGFICFAQRVQNSLNYESPNWSGFSFGLSTTTTGSALNTSAASPSEGLKGRIYSGYGKYDRGPLLVWAGYEKHDDNQTVASGGLDGTSENLTTVGASYVLGPVKVGFTYTAFKGDVDTVDDLKRDSFLIGADWKVTPAGTVRVAYMEAGEYKGSAAAGTSNTGAKQYNIHYIHAFSKRTWGAVYYVKVDNDGDATMGGEYNYHGFNDAVKAGDSAGAFVVQLQHNF